MSKNLILSAAVGLNFEQIRFFIESLRKYYLEDLCLIIDKNDADLERKLKDYNCNLIKTSISKKQIQYKRYEIFLKYIEKKSFDKILLCDSRDIYFQANPFNYNYDGKINFFLEDYKIKDCPHNSNWIIKTYGNDEYNSISEKTILCSGTVLGNSKNIKEYLDLLSKNILKFKFKKKFKYFITMRSDPEERGCDQGHANYIVHKSLINNVNFYSNHSGPFATIFYLKKITFDEKSRLINTKGEPYVLVHQYDKKWEVFSNHINRFKENL